MGTELLPEDLVRPRNVVLMKGLNYAVTPKQIPVIDIVSATETACRSLNSADANELRSSVVQMLKKDNIVKEQNVTKEERSAIRDLSNDDSIMILPADKGRVTVVMDKTEYTNKCNALLSDIKTYKKLKLDPTSKYKKEIVSALKGLKDRKIITTDLHRNLYPTVDQPPRFYGLPKVHKAGTPLRPIVSSIGTITYNCAQYLAKVLSPLVGNTIHHVKNSTEFAAFVRDIKLEDDEEIRSYDVSALFTSVPVDKALDIIKTRLTNDPTLKDRSTLSPEDIIRLLDICLKCTYFVFQGQFYLQIHGAAMGSPVSPIVCNLYMEDFEQRTLQLAQNPPRIWKRYVDDTFTVMKRCYTDEFSRFINSVDSNIQWTTEGETITSSENAGPTERKLPFLDTLNIVEESGTIKTKVFRKDTHTDQYLNFDSNHPLEHKRGVVRTLMNRAKCVVSNDEDLQQEVNHLKAVLKINRYPDWIFKPHRMGNAPNGPNSNRRSVGVHKKIPVVLPYVKGLSEQLRRTFMKHGIPVYYKPVNTLRQLLVRPKDKIDKERVVGPVYQINCTNCNTFYIGETERSLKARFLEHRRPSTVTSEVSRHINHECPTHNISMSNTKILTTEPRWFERGVKEAIHIRTNQPPLNKDGGRHNLSPIWTNLLRKRSGGGGPQNSHFTVSHSFLTSTS